MRLASRRCLVAYTASLCVQLFIEHCLKITQCGRTHSMLLANVCLNCRRAMLIYMKMIDIAVA